MTQREPYTETYVGMWPTPSSSENSKKNSAHTASQPSKSTMKIHMPTRVNSYGMTETELQVVPVCKISWIIMGIRYDFDQIFVVLEKGQIVQGYVKWEMAIWWYSPLKDYFAKKPVVWDTFWAIITDKNVLVINENNIAKYPNVMECSLTDVQQQSKKMFPDIDIRDMPVLGAQVTGNQKGKTVDYCQINEIVLTTKTSMLKNKKGTVTAFIFQTSDGELYIAREQISFPTAKNSSIAKALDADYQTLHGKKFHVIIDRGNQNSIVSEYRSNHQNLPFCIQSLTAKDVQDIVKKMEENTVIYSLPPDSGQAGNSQQQVVPMWWDTWGSSSWGMMTIGILSIFLFILLLWMLRKYGELLWFKLSPEQ